MALRFGRGVTAAVFTKWLTTAKRGDSISYFRGSLDMTREINPDINRMAIAVRNAIEDGLVVSVQRRETPPHTGTPGDFVYIAQCTKRPVSHAARVRELETA